MREAPAWLSEVALSVGAGPTAVACLQAFTAAMQRHAGVQNVWIFAPSTDTPTLPLQPWGLVDAGAPDFPALAVFAHAIAGVFLRLPLGEAGQMLLHLASAPSPAEQTAFERVTQVFGNTYAAMVRAESVPGPSTTTPSVSTERFLQSVIENIPDMIFVKDAKELRFVRFNRAGERLLGWSRDALMGKNDHDFFPPDEAEFFIDMDREVLNSGKLLEISEEPIHTAGGTRYLHTKKIPIFDDAGQPAYLLGISEDITEKKLGAAALRERERRFQNLFECAPVVLWEMDASGAVPDLQMLRDAASSVTVRVRRIFAQLRTLSVNDAALRLFGTADVDALNRNLPELLASGRHGANLLECFVELLDGQHVVEREISVRRLDGATVHALVRVAVPGDRPVDLSYVLVAMTDITALKDAEDALSRSALELRRSNADLQQFAYVASHDLQEPLRVIAGFSELLRKGHLEHLNEEGREFLDYITNGTTRMQRLIRDLLAYARVDNRGERTVLASLEEPLNQALANLQVSLEECGGRIEAPPPLPTVAIDTVLMVQVFQNLIGNALKFRSGAPPVVRISTQSRGDWVEVSVTDNGIGFDPKYADRIFEIFQRLHGPTTYSGTGIGLAVCKKIVERHGGTIRADSAPGQGATFRFTLPLRAPR